MSAERVRLGVLGAGWFVSRRHLPDAKQHSQIELTALCRRDQEELAKMANHFGVAEEGRYTDWREMLAQAQLDAVLIATPNALHYEQAAAALDAGLHVLLEKPMTIHSAEAQALVAQAQAKGLTLAVALNPPYWAHCHRIRRSLRKPEMGALESVQMYWTGTSEFLFGRADFPDKLPGVVKPTLYRGDPELNGGGCFIDGGSHLISEVIWCSDQRVRRVSALMDATPADFRTVVSLELERGAVASVTAVSNSRHPMRRVYNTFGAEHGTITVTGFDFRTAVHIEGQEPQHFQEENLLPVATPVSNFADAILGKGTLYGTAEHGAHVVEVVEAVYESAATGRTITLPNSASS